ncbi:MAG: hypothetical protein LBQ10_10975 [Desulfovibrio sp.]|jgi:hypothetical protein|nr:hypothetical protein [Desulfovibrio sp.]
MHDSTVLPDKPEESGSEDRLEELQKLLLKGMADLATSIDGLKSANASPASDVAQTAPGSRNTEQRLTILEEGFARICMVVGRLDQQMRTLLANNDGLG